MGEEGAFVNSMCLGGERGLFLVEEDTRIHSWLCFFLSLFLCGLFCIVLLQGKESDEEEKGREEEKEDLEAQQQGGACRSNVCQR